MGPEITEVSTHDPRTADVLQAVADERCRQDQKWGQQNWTPAVYQLILAEEVGEAAKEACQYTFEKNKQRRAAIRRRLRDELVQAAAVAVAWIEALDRQSQGEDEICPESHGR